MALDLSRAERWWEDWQLRVLVLGSLSLQFVLFAASMVRNRCIPRWCRSCIWLAYVGADALAVYALATLFNRHKLMPTTGILEVMWAPVLLVHLGGQHTFTAYSIEDNELWGRYVVTLVSQVTVAVYVFYKSWPAGGDKRLLQAAVLLFIVGILKFIQKPWILWSASINSVMTSSAVYPQRGDERSSYALFMSFLTLYSVEDAKRMKEEEEHDHSLDEYVLEASSLVLKKEVDNDHGRELSHHDTCKLFVDLSAPYCRRRRNLRSFLGLHDRDKRHAYALLRGELSVAFAVIYTSLKGKLSSHGLLLELLLPFVTLASVVLFAKSDKEGHDKRDVKVTIILFSCSAFLEFLPFFISRCQRGYAIRSITVAQHNLISFYARKSKPARLMKLCPIMCCKDYINKHWYIEHAPEPACADIADLVVAHVKDGWRHYIKDGAHYRRFNNFRGQWTVSRHQEPRRRTMSGNQEPRRMCWNLTEVPFDRSVMIWHIATELCIHHPRTTKGSPATAAARCSRLISNYMIYLLFVRPEMLMPGTRQGLFTSSCDDIGVMLSLASPLPPPSSLAGGTGGVIARMILQMAKFPWVHADSTSFWIQRACKLAEDLMELLVDEEERWEVIQGVWVEMLCYSASRCRGYLHAKSMGEGVEFLTFIWLLLSNMGMETFADRFQRPEHAEEDVIAGAVKSEPQDIPVEETRG